MNLRTSLIGAINLITTFITIAIAITTPVFANKNIFNHMALTNIKIETNINGEKIYRNIKVSPKLTKTRKKSNINQLKNTYLSNSKINSKIKSKIRKYFIPQINSLPKILDYINYTKDINNINNINKTIRHPDLKYHKTNFSSTNNNENIFDKDPEKNYKKIALEPEKENSIENKSIKNIIKNLTSIKISKNTIISSLNYNLSKDFSVNAQWQIDKPTKTPSKLRRYLSNNPDDKAVSLYSLAVNMMF